MALTPLHSLRLFVGECNVVKRRSFRGTWELTPPAPTGLDGVSVAVGKQAMATPYPWVRKHWVRRPAIRAPADGRTDWFAGGAGRHPGSGRHPGHAANRRA